MGADPLSIDSVTETPARYAIWWAGPVIGLVNLIPALPLDGGTIASLGVDRVAPGRGRITMMYVSLGLAAAGLLAVVVYPIWRPSILIVALIAVSNLHELRQRRSGDDDDAVDRRLLAAAHGAEAQAWASGRPGLFPPGVRPSPWFLAHQQLQARRPDQARAMLVTSLEDGRTDWLPPRGRASTSSDRSSISCPQELPTANRYGGQVLISVLEQVGELRRAAAYGATLYRAHPSGSVAHQVARALALLGYDDDAVGWLRLAVERRGQRGRPPRRPRPRRPPRPLAADLAAIAPAGSAMNGGGSGASRVRGRGGRTARGPARRSAPAPARSCRARGSSRRRPRATRSRP